jgi:Protein of unknown function (DUF3352)
MRAMRRVAIAAVCAVVCALGAVGCGGSSSGTATTVASGAEVAPADSIGFVAVNTDRGSEQWKQGEALLKKFPLRDKLIEELNRDLSEHGLDLERDVLPSLGPEVDVVFVDVAGKPEAVGLTQPPNELVFEELLAKSSEPLKHERIGDWTAFSDEQAALDAVLNAKDHLDGADAFRDAMGRLPDEANAKAYVNGAELAPTLRARSSELANVPLGSLEWAAVAISSHEDGWKLDGAWKSKEGSAKTFSPSLLDRVPAGSLLVASFKGSDQTFAQLRNTPQGQQAMGQIQQLLGVGFDQLTRLAAGEGVLYVRQTVLIPEVTLILKQKDQRTAAATLKTVASRAALFFGSRPVKANASGSVKKLPFGNFAVYYGLDGGNLVISDSLAAFGRKPSSTIEHDPVFEKAKSAAGMPDETSGFLYVNVQDAVPVIEGIAQLSGQTLPPEVSQNLAPLQSFLVYGSSSDGVTKFSALLQVR